VVFIVGADLIETEGKFPSCPDVEIWPFILKRMAFLYNVPYIMYTTSLKILQFTARADR